MSNEPAKSADLNVLIPPGSISLIDLPRGWKITYTAPETPEAATHRRSTETRNWWLAVLISIALIVGGFVYSFLGPTDDLRKLGLGVVGSTFTALLGFLIGQASKK